MDTLLALSMTNKKFLWCAWEFLFFGRNFCGGLWIATLALWLARNDSGNFGVWLGVLVGFVGIFGACGINSAKFAQTLAI